MLMKQSCRNTNTLDSKLGSRHKIGRDPFTSFPRDILNLIFPYLSHKEVLVLRQASWHVYQNSRDNSFWSSMLRREILSWLWELRSPNILPDNVDMRRMYLWFYKHTTPSFGSREPFLAISNRRRIWATCEEIKELYMKQI